MTENNFQLSVATTDIPAALSIEFNQFVYDLKRSGLDPIVLSLGESYFDIPLYDFRALDLNKAYHYSDSQGIPELRERIAKYYKQHYGAHIDPERELLISAGSKPLIFMAMLCTLNPGDEVLIHEPAWLSYREQARLVGADVKFIPFDVPVEQFDQYMTDKTKLLIINNPNNPAGKLYERAELEMLYAKTSDASVWLLVDEAYSDFVLDRSFTSIAEVAPDKRGVILVNSLSKNMGISGWRIGYVATSPDLLYELLKVNQHIITCAPTILLQYCTKYFDEIIKTTLPQVADVVAKRARIAKWIDELGLERTGGESTFYFFVGIGDYAGTSRTFALKLLLDHNISVVPGTAYGDSVARFIRVSIGTESEERIWQALQIIRSMTKEAAVDSALIEERLVEFKTRMAGLA